MPFAPCLPRRTRHVPGDMIMPYGRRCRAYSEERATWTPSMPGKLPPCRARWAASDCSPPRPHSACSLLGLLGGRVAYHTRTPAAVRGQLRSARRGRALFSGSGTCTSHLTGPRLERLPHMAHAPRRRSPRPTSGARCRGLAAWLAVPRIADAYRTLSRSRAPALLAAQFARTAPLPSRSAPGVSTHMLRPTHLGDCVIKPSGSFMKTPES